MHGLIPSARPTYVACSRSAARLVIPNRRRHGYARPRRLTTAASFASELQWFVPLCTKAAFFGFTVYFTLNFLKYREQRIDVEAINTGKDTKD